MKRLNIITEIILVLATIRQFFAFAHSLIYIGNPYIDQVLCIWSIFIGALCITIYVGMILVKKWALFGFFTLQCTNAAFLSIFIDGKYAQHFIVALILSGFMSLLLLLPKNGVSGWKAFFSEENRLDEGDSQE